MVRLEQHWISCSIKRARTTSGSRERCGRTVEGNRRAYGVGSTSTNCSPARIVFVKSQEAKARLKPHLSPGNVEKTMAAPATGIPAYDLRFYDYLPRLSADPAADAKSWFAGKKSNAQHNKPFATAPAGRLFQSWRRALGLDCGPMPDLIMLGLMPSFPWDRHKVQFPMQSGLWRSVRGLSTVATV